MGLFSKTGGLFGKIGRAVGDLQGKIFDIGSKVTGFKLPNLYDKIGLTTDSKIEPGQKYTNKQIAADNTLYVPAGESYTIGELQVNNSLIKMDATRQLLKEAGLVSDVLSQPPKNTIVDKAKGFIDNILGTASNANESSKNVATATKLLNYGLIAVAIYIVYKLLARIFR